MFLEFRICTILAEMITTHKCQQTRVYPYPWARGPARPNPKMGALDPENPLFLGFSVLRGGLRPWSQTMVSQGARPWGRGRSGDCEIGRRFAHQRFADSRESIRRKKTIFEALGQIRAKRVWFALKFAWFASNPRCYPIFGRLIRKKEVSSKRESIRRDIRDSANWFARIGRLRLQHTIPWNELYWMYVCSFSS